MFQVHVSDSTSVRALVVRASDVEDLTLPFRARSAFKVRCFGERDVSSRKFRRARQSSTFTSRSAGGYVRSGVSTTFVRKSSGLHRNLTLSATWPQALQPDLTKHRKCRFESALAGTDVLSVEAAGVSLLSAAEAWGWYTMTNHLQ